MKYKSSLTLLLAAIIWGFAFVAQRVGMDYIGPFTFNGVRFALGAISLLPLIYFFNQQTENASAEKPYNTLSTIKIGLIAGLILFSGASLQQIGLLYTTAGKAAFITCLYIVLVPIAGIFLKHRTTIATWLGCGLAVIGLYLLCVKESFVIAYGDLLQLIGAFFWTAHIMFIDHYSPKVDSLKLAFFQFIGCSALSLITALLTETITFGGIIKTTIPLLYGGFCSVGIAYTLQIVGQKDAPPSTAAIILSLETVFAVIGGFLILDEYLGQQEILGCALMLAGMLLSQLQSFKTASADKTA